MNKTKLFEDFPSISSKEWRDKIHTDLKGANFDKRMVWKTIEGFNVQPYYMSEDLDNIEATNIEPGQFPYIRGQKHQENHWLIRQDFELDDIQKLNKIILDALTKGIESIGLYFKNNKPTEKDFDVLLKNIHLEAIEINFYSSDFNLINILLQYIEQHNIKAENIKGSLNIDPLSHLITNGDCSQKTIEDAFSKIKDTILLAQKHLPNFHIVAVNTHIFLDAGSSITQELAYGLSMANTYLSDLSESIDIDRLSRSIRFNMGVSSNYFMEIAKIRALRHLWSKLTEAYGIKDKTNAQLFIHTQSTYWNKTRFDPYVNMLRTTTEAMSSILGGIDSHTILPFNKAFEKTTVFSERIAKNQQIILREEAHLDKVIDPSAGSYYIEKLTHALIENAWQLFLDIDEKGGFYTCIKKGIIQKEIEAMAQQRDLNLATKQEILLGTNQYANVLESSVGFSTTEASKRKTSIKTIRRYRAAEPFEKLRIETEKATKKPKVMMFTYGHLAMQKARAQFSSNFFASAGYQIQDNDGFKTIEEGIQKAIKEQPDVLVLCSSDDSYTDMITPINKALKNCIIVVAGYPKEDIDTLTKEGVSYFIHAKSNILETLQEFNKKLIH